MNKYGLIGFPLGHSFSKKYFKEKFAREGIRAEFYLWPIESIDELPALLQESKNLKGFAITIPHKQAVRKYLHAQSDAAEKIGAVNCVQITDGNLTGYNTDVIGFEKSFVPLLQPHHKSALVLGTGGASKAVQYVLNKLKIPFTLVSRTAAGKTMAYEEVTKEKLQENFIIINTTPLGMMPAIDTKPNIPYDYLTQQHYAYDLVYKPEETLFLKLAGEQGAITKNGLEMLHLQAEENWNIWQGGER